MRVNLFFRVAKDPVLRKRVKDIEIIRLKVLVRFQASDGWTDPYEAIVDTGAHVSLIPLSIWQESVYTELAIHKIKGIVPKPECTLLVKVGKLHCRLMDHGGNRTRPLEIYGFLAPTDEVSLILGFKDLLMQFAHHFDYRTDIAYISTRKLRR